MIEAVILITTALPGILGKILLSKSEMLIDEVVKFVVPLFIIFHIFQSVDKGSWKIICFHPVVTKRIFRRM